MAEVRSAYKSFARNLKERNLLENFGIDGQDVKIWTGVIWFKVGLCEHCKQCSGSIKCGKFVE